MTELAKLESDSENLLAGKSAAEMKEAILKEQGQTPEVETPAEEPTETVAEPVEETTEIQREEPKPELDYQSVYQKGVQDALSQFKDILTKQQTQTEPAKKRSADEILESFTSDPENFISDLIERKITPHRSEIRKIEENSIRATARRTNPEFARLEPVIDKIRDVHPNLVQGKGAAETLEVLFLIAKGLDAQDKERQSQKSKDQSSMTQAEKKRSASMLPQGTRKVLPAEEDKPFEKLSSAEMKKRIMGMVRQ